MNTATYFHLPVGGDIYINYLSKWENIYNYLLGYTFLISWIYYNNMS